MMAYLLFPPLHGEGGWSEATVGWGDLRLLPPFKRCHVRVHHAIQILPNLMVPEPEDAKSFSPDDAVTDGIVRRLVSPPGPRFARVTLPIQGREKVSSLRAHQLLHAALAALLVAVEEFGEVASRPALGIRR